MNLRSSNLLLICVSLVVGRAFARDITLSWDASPSPNIAGYAVLWYPTNTPLTSNIIASLSPAYRTNVGNVLTTRFNLTNDTAFWAIAIDASGLESDLSNPVFAPLVLPPKMRKITYTTTLNFTQQ